MTCIALKRVAEHCSEVKWSVVKCSEVESKQLITIACCLLVAWLAREALGLGLVGGGCEMVHLRHVSEKPSHVEGGLSTLGFAIRVDCTPNITKEVPGCGWPWFSSAEKSIWCCLGGGAPSRYACLLLLGLLGRPLGGPWTGACGRGVRNGAFRACFRKIVAC